MVAAAIANMRQGERTDIQPVSHGPQVAGKKTRDIAAKMLNVGPAEVIPISSKRNA
jgi:hypothetical protein